MSLKTSAPLPHYDESKLPLKQIFNREAAQAVKDFPQLDGRFIFIDAPDKIAIDDYFDRRLLGRHSDYEYNQMLVDLKNSAEQAGSSMSTKLGNNDIDVMVYTPLPFRLFTSKTQPGEMEVMATFDHELGHLVVKGGFFSRDSTLRESAADCFAVLRHIQRYGEQSEAIDRGGWRRAFDFVMSGDDGHFTTLAVDEVPQLLNRLDVKAMTPQQTADLAGRLALAYTPHADVTSEAARSFESVRRIMQQGHYQGYSPEETLEAAMQKLAQVTLSDKASFYTFKIGARCLERFLEGKVSTDDGPIELKGKFWDQVRQKLEDRTEKLEKEGMLLDMPLKKGGGGAGRTIDLSPQPANDRALAKPQVSANTPANAPAAPEPKKHFWSDLFRRAI